MKANWYRDRRVKAGYADELMAAARGDDTLFDALVETYMQCKYEGGQHSLVSCRVCHAEASWHTGELSHDDSGPRPCPVGTVDGIMRARRELQDG